LNFPGIVAFGLKHNVVRHLSPEITNLYLRPFIPPSRRGIAAFFPGQITAATEYFAQLEAGLPRLADKQILIFWALKDLASPIRIVLDGSRLSQGTTQLRSLKQAISSLRMKRTR